MNTKSSFVLCLSLLLLHIPLLLARGGKGGGKGGVGSRVRGGVGGGGGGGGVSTSSTSDHGNAHTNTESNGGKASSQTQEDDYNLHTHKKHNSSSSVSVNDGMNQNTSLPENLYSSSMNRTNLLPAENQNATTLSSTTAEPNMKNKVDEMDSRSEMEEELKARRFEQSFANASEGTKELRMGLLWLLAVVLIFIK